jgi:DNA-binding transcriptional LysR family regulator
MTDGLTIHQLLCFDAVVTEGGFQAAAERLLRSQPAVSSEVKNLETELRLTLLDRSGYRVSLTEAISGPWERLLDDEADLILHHIDKSDPRLEFIDLFTVKLVPVVAPGFLRFPVSQSVTPEQMRDYVQCVIRDSARRPAPLDYYLVEGARSWTVSDQLMKRELILQGMGWGHLPRYLIEQDLRDARLLPIMGKHFKGGQVELVAARRRETPHGPVAERLWHYIREQAADLTAAVKTSGVRKR